MGTRYGFNVTIGADTNPFSQALKRLNAPIKEAQNELTKMNKALKLDPTNVTLIKNAHSELATQIRESQNKVKGLEEVLKQLNEEERKNGELTIEQVRLRRSVESEIEIEKKKIKDLTTEYNKWGNVTIQQIAGVGEQLKTLGSKVEAVGKSLRVVSALAGGALVGIAKSAMDFEDAWVGVTKTVEGTDTTPLEKVRQDIIDMSKETGIAKGEIAGVAQVAGQLGISADDLSEFTRVMVNLGVATDLTAEESAEAIAKIANITDMTMDEYKRFGSALTALGNNFATQESNILNMATRLASTGDLVGLTEPQILALSTTLNSLGAEAEAGGTAMSKMFRKMQLSVETENKSLAKFARVAGMSVKDFKKAFQEDALGALNAFVKGLGTSGDSAIAILDDMGLSEVRLSDSLLKLVSSEGMLDDALKISNQAWTDQKALTDEASKRYGETKYKLGQLKETLDEIAVDLGEILLPIIKKVVDKVKEFTDKFTNMDDKTKKIILTVLGIVAVLSPLLILLGKVMIFIGQLMTFLPALAPILTGLGGGFTALLSPVGLVVAIIAGAVAGFVLLYNKSEAFRNQLINLGNSMKETYDTYLKPAIDSFMELLGKLWNDVLSPLLSWLWDVLEPKITEITGRIFTAFDWAFTGISGLLKGFMTFLNGVLDFIVGVFTGDWDRAWTGVKEIFGGIFEAMKGLAVKPLNWIIDKINEFLGNIGSIKLPDWIASATGISEISIPKIPNIALAKGGIVAQPTQALIGEAGAEAVIPLSKLPKLLAESLEKEGVKGNTLNIYTQELDSAKLEEIVNYVNVKFGMVY